MNTQLSCYLLLVVICTGAGCANITAPTGGKKDTTPPKLVSIEPADSLKNTRVKRIEMYFDKYLTGGDITKEVQMSPILTIQPTATALNKHVIVKIVDSLLENNTTYRVSFGNGIKDLHEGNVFTKYIYTFSTGAYFDSLQLRGTVKNAATGLSDLEGISVELYYASESDSAVVRHKPKYVTKAEANGVFVFKGLPKRTFRIYALKDANDNLIYDGVGPGEMIGFLDNTIVPGDTTQGPIVIRVFTEIPDTIVKKSMDSLSTKKEKERLGGKSKQNATEVITYSVNVDTANAEKRTYDITSPIKVSFNKLPLLNKDKITLSFDSSGVTLSPPIAMTIDSPHHFLQIKPAYWGENMVYTLRLVKGFAKDTAGADLAPSRYVFRTKEEDDYGTIRVNLPAKYNSSLYLLRVMADNDSVYQKPVTDTVILLRYLKPAKYTFRIIVDKNRNGKWDTGDLFGKLQPEEVIPYTESVPLKAGWENVVDFEQKPAPKKGMQPDKEGGK